MNPYPASWVVELLQYTEQSPLYDLWKQNPPGNSNFGSNGLQSPLDLYIPFCVCPSDAQETTPGQQPLAYVVNAGQMDAEPKSGSAPSGNENLPADWPGNGVFMNRYGVSGNTVPELPQTSVSRPMANVSNDTMTRDGLSNTLMLSENVDAHYYYDHGFLPTPGSAVFPKQVGFNNSNPFTTPEIYTTMIWVPETDPAKIDPRWRINGGAPFSGTAVDMNYCRPSSNHPGVVVATFCDGRSQTLSETMDYRVYCLLMSTDGRKVNPPGMQFTQTGSLPGALQAPYNYFRTQVLDLSDVN